MVTFVFYAHNGCLRLESEAKSNNPMCTQMLRSLTYICLMFSPTKLDYRLSYSTNIIQQFDILFCNYANRPKHWITSADARAKALVFAHLQVVMNVSFNCSCCCFSPVLVSHSYSLYELASFCCFINFNSIYTIAVQFS